MYNRDRQTDIHIPLHTKHVRTIFIVALNSHIFSYSRSVIVILVPLKIKTVQYFLSLSQYSLYLLLNGTLPPPPFRLPPPPPSLRIFRFLYLQQDLYSWIIVLRSFIQHPFRELVSTERGNEVFILGDRRQLVSFQCQGVVKGANATHGAF